MYIADSVNHRIQRWNQNESAAVTIAGDPNGVAGAGPTMLNYPYSVALNEEETFLYVIDCVNLRVQRFDLLWIQDSNLITFSSSLEYLQNENETGTSIKDRSTRCTYSHSST